MPTTTTGAPGANFVGLGYHTDDGVSTNYQPEFEEIMGWQSAYPLRRIRTSESLELQFALLQWDENTTPAAFGGGTVTGTSPNFTFTPPAASDAIVEKTAVVDVIDGSNQIRFIIPRATTTESVESNFKRGSAAELPVTLKSLEAPGGGPSWYFLTNSPAFAPGS